LAERKERGKTRERASTRKRMPKGVRAVAIPAYAINRLLAVVEAQPVLTVVPPHGFPFGQLNIRSCHPQSRVFWWRLYTARPERLRSRSRSSDLPNQVTQATATSAGPCHFRMPFALSVSAAPLAVLSRSRESRQETWAGEKTKAVTALTPVVHFTV
jgi:hypothetical protein